MFLRLRLYTSALSCGLFWLVPLVASVGAAEFSELGLSNVFEAGIPVSPTPTPEANSGTPAESPGAVAPPANVEPDAQVPLPGPPPAAAATAPPKPPAPPKKPAPPVFPGPKTLPPTGPYKVLFFDNDFTSYKKDPKHEYLFGEELKNMPTEIFGQPLLISTGGEIRHRYMNEDNRLRPGGPKQTDYDLWRWRHYFDIQSGDFRVFAEGIEADSFGSTLPDQAIDVNRWDIQNLFGDWTFLRNDLGTHTVRYGRQELLFGRQRLVSPLDWANTRRNFEGIRYMLKGTDYKLDLFSTHPVNSATGFQPVSYFANHLDQPNSHVWFSGAYFNYTGVKNTVYDAYWLYLDTTTLKDPTRPYGHRHLFGGRMGKLFPTDDESRVWDLDTEGGLQTGSSSSQQVLAGFYTAVAGHTWKRAPWTPRLSSTFYYGSGDQTPKNGTNNTFNTLFPLGHAYWAISDNLTGQNLYNYALQADVKPTKKTAITTAYHWFELASANDTLYTVAGAPFGGPGRGRKLGQALDIYGYYAVNPSFDVQMGYSWFFYGDYFNTTPRGDATQFYVQTSLRY